MRVSSMAAALARSPSSSHCPACMRAHAGIYARWRLLRFLQTGLAQQLHLALKVSAAASAEVRPALFGLMRRHAFAARAHCMLLLALTVLLLLASVSDGIRPAPVDAKLVQGQEKATATASQGSLPTDDGLLLQEEVRATGSSLPDCSHACGACSPCSRVMVSFKCSVAEPLPCPMVYRCMCRGKCYPVPSS